MASFELKALITGVDKLSPALNSMQKKIKGFQRGIKKAGFEDLNLGDIITGGAIAAPFVAGAKAAIDFESEMADVRKVVNFDTPDQFRQMGDDILKMSERLPMAASDIAKLVAAGGQAGFAREELQGFAEDALKMGVAFDQSADVSGDMMAKWRTSFKMTQKEVVALADKINYLSDNGAANAQQISDIVTRVGPLGEVAGIASGEIAALGSTMAGVGVQQEIAATGIKNLMLALTKGKAATNKQAAGWKVLGFDAEQIAKDMQKDAKGTILKVMESISKLSKERQAPALSVMFGNESIAAIAPLLTNLDLVKQNFAMVADASKYAGSMQREFENRSATTANQLQLLRNQATATGIAIGNALLPAINSGAKALGPMLGRVNDFITHNPELVKGLAGAAVAFTALKIGIFGVTVATRVLSAVVGMSPVGIILRGVALIAGVIIANWSKVAPFFQRVWGGIKSLFNAGSSAIKDTLGFSPLEMIVAAWGSLQRWFSTFWSGVVSTANIAWGIIKTAFAFSPLGLIIGNWGAISSWFADLWRNITGWFTGGQSVVMDVLSWTPLGLIVSNWDVIKGWFSLLWESITQVFKNGLSLFESVFGWSPLESIKSAWGPVVGWFESMWEKVSPIIEYFKGNAGKSLAEIQAGVQNNSYTSEISGGKITPYQITPSTNKQSEVNVNVDFANTPAGTRVAAKAKGGVNVNENVGYTSLSRAYGMGS